MSNTTLLDVMVNEFQPLFGPLKAATDDPKQRQNLFAAIGVDLDQSQLAGLDARFDDISNAYDGIQDLVNTHDDPSLDELMRALEDVSDLFSVLNDIEDDLSGVDVDDIPEKLVEHLVLRYLFANRPIVLQLATLLLIVQLPDPDTVEVSGSQLPYPYQLPLGTTFSPDRVENLLEDPIGALKQTYLLSNVSDADNAAAVEQLVFPALAELFGVLGFRLAIGREQLDIQDYDDVTGLQLVSRSITIYKDLGDAGSISFWFALGLTDNGLCLAVAPKVSNGIDFEGGSWKTALSLTGGFDIVVVNSEGIIHSSPETSRIEAGASLTKTGSQGGEAAFRLGSSDGTHLVLGRYGVRESVEIIDDKIDVDTLAKASDSNITVSPGDGDSFLSYVLPEDGISTEFDLGLGWSNRKGIYLEGSGSLDAHLPLHLSFSEALTVNALDVSVSAGDGSIPVSVTTTPNVELGPVAGAIEGVGLRADFAFPEGMDGNLGPVDLGFGFKPPGGITLSINVGTVTGGGYLSFDPENERYTGAISLNVGKLTLNAVGLLTTELPDGSDGFSLLVVITGEFPPVQLGFGFTLNGVGGLLGVNRSARVSALRSSVREGSLESVLFPQDPLSNIPRLVSDLREFFPATKDQHVFGPMAKIGWGTPSIIKADLGVILELPSPLRLLVLGRLSAVLPDDDAAILQLQMNALGVISFTEQKASLDASLYDSRVTTFPLTGNMAMRTDWGDDPGFGLSVGGWNPRFEPPESFPALDRVAVSLTDGNNPRLRLAGYFAVTSNTAQVGAAVDLYAAAAGFSVDGHLGFDALFQFDPFKFVVDVGASVAFKHGSTTLLSASFDGTLSGPTPWHARGKASIEILFLEASVSFDAKFGSSSQPGGMPPAEVLSKLTAAVGDRRNWAAQMPETDASFVRLREIEPVDGEVLAHPLGQLGFRQRVVPLGIRIEKYGSAKPADYNTFSVGAVRTVAPTGGETTENQTHDRGDLRANFAPDQYFELSDSERLSRPSFEKLPAGEVVASDDLAFGGMDDESRQGVASHARTRTLKYESHYVDEDETKTTDTVMMARTTADSLAEVNAVATGEARNSGRKSFVGPDQSVPVADATYVVASVTDLRQRIDSGLPETGTTYIEAEQALETYRANHAVDDLQVVASHEAREPEGVTP